MHTATDIHTHMFEVQERGHPLDAQRLLEFQPLDRFGIVVDEPFGALGASLLVSLAIASYFDVPGKQRRTTNVYPEIYLFHRGGPWGCHSSFDFWPEGKEVFVEPDPVELLRAINRFGITHLAIPEKADGDVVHRYREPESALDRLKKCFAYAPTGHATQADITISTTAPKVLWNLEGTLRPELYIDDMESALASDASYQSDTPMAQDFRRVIRYVRARWDEVSRESSAYRFHSARTDAARAASHLRESIRSLTPTAALSMLA